MVPSTLAVEIVFNPSSAWSETGGCVSTPMARSVATVRARAAQAAARNPLSSRDSLMAQCTSVFICRIGMRSENTMKATTPPIITIITGSRRLVRAPILVSTWES